MKLLVVGLALFPLLCAAQERPSDAPIPTPRPVDRFLGEWKLNTEKSSRVGLESETVKIDTAGSEYRFEYNLAGENGAVLHWWFVTGMKGECVKPNWPNGQKGTSQACVTRLDANRFVDKTLFGKDEYEVSRDGQRMTIHRTLLHATMKLVFDRAASSN